MGTQNIFLPPDGGDPRNQNFQHRPKRRRKNRDQRKKEAEKKKEKEEESKLKIYRKAAFQVILTAPIWVPILGYAAWGFVKLYVWFFIWTAEKLRGSW